MNRLPQAILLGSLLLALSTRAPDARAAFSFTTIDVAGSASTVAEGINNAGQVVGYYTTGGVTHGFLRSADGSSYTTIDPAGTTNTTVTGINDAGQVVGYALIAGQAGYQGFIRAVDGSFNTFNYPTTSSTFIGGINNLGQVSGYTTTFFPPFFQQNTAFIRSAGGSTTTIADALTALGINDSGQVILSSGGPASYLRNANGSITNLPTGRAYNDINNLGRIAGSGLGANGQGVAIVLEADLTTFTEINIPTQGSVAYGLNDPGQVVGSYYNSSGKQVGFLATPAAAAAVPEPASLAMLGVGLLASAGGRPPTPAGPA